MMCAKIAQEEIMPKQVRMPEGNYLRKARFNASLSNDCRMMMQELSAYKGVNACDVIELAVREMYETIYGKGKRPEKSRGWTGGA